VLVTVLGAPHADDSTTSVLRLVQGMLGRGGRVQVWACGYATMLTQRSLGPYKPRNVAAWSTDYPSTAALVDGLLDAFPDRLFWYGCAFCSEERGAGDHLPRVVVRSPARYGENVAAAGKTLMIGLI
jgi:hypothetical protein